MGLNDLEHWRLCGHPKTPENTNAGGGGRCRLCHNVYSKQWHKDHPEAYRRRILPEQLEAARHKVRALENEAHRLGMKELLTNPRHVNEAWDRAIDEARGMIP